MTVKELYDKLGKEIEAGYGDLRVIANCEKKLRTVIGGYERHEFYLTHLNNVYYQGGDIELGFSEEE